MKPTAVYDDVIHGPIQLTKTATNFKSREVEFSRLELTISLSRSKYAIIRRLPFEVLSIDQLHQAEILRRLDDWRQVVARSVEAQELAWSTNTQLG
jgi:hypothetical protein